MTKRHYSQEFKHDALQYYFDSKDHMTVIDIAKHLGVGVSTLHKWIKQFNESGEVGRGSGNFKSDLEKENAQLKRKLRDAEAAIEVLKKSIGILSK